MKKTLLLGVCLLAFAAQAIAQKPLKSKVPTKVLSAFKKKFPDAKKVKWEKENDMEWEAEFKMNRKEYSANFSNDGSWKETEYEIKKTEIPADVRSVLDKNLKKYKIIEAEVAETTAEKAYEFEVKVGKEKLEVVIDSKGNFNKKKKQDKNDED